ncbi:MAG TPA: HAMP domain-containing sensor histidine kinase [Candidatus Latescibacteria bacterium]|jgi:signal transduction histidine kinase|nr:HAMP domain-containing sensor histidine kinase [Candidatus Latescibacterota bacterium]
MTPSSQDPTTDAGAPEPGRRRRRRRTDDAKNAPPAKRGETPNGRSRGSSGGGGLIPASWGLTPTFRVLLFLGAIVAVMSFLLYNEYLIREVSEQERFRAELYANLYGLAVSEALPPEYSALIADRILINPTIDLPLIVTNYRGEIILEKGTGLLAGDEHPETRRKLEELMDRMDAVNEPVKAHWTTQARGRVYIDGTHVIVTDPTHYPVAWAGEDLPALVEEGDPAPIQVVNTLQEMMEAGVQPKDFTAQASNTCYLAQSGDEFIIIEMGNASPLVWGGDQLPAPTDTTAYSLVRSSYDALAAEHAPVAFQLRTEHFIHFGDTELFNRISLAPVVTLGVLCLFGLIGYVGFRNMRRSEQRSIWVGMAKETAHQLGTPLSSLSGWLELMQQRLEDLQQRGDKSEAEAVASIATEMQRDMGRLNQIASRFSQIGSVPELQSGDLGEVVTDSLNYFRGRGSQFGRHTFEADVPPLPKIPLNAELMGWVFENLFKNAIDAMIGQDGQIRVLARLDEERDEVVVVVEDNGCGIKAEHLPRVFEPGFSTKKRGWGLGLAFVKRIIEEYHSGRIQVMQSERGQGTTFEISLPTS